MAGFSVSLKLLINHQEQKVVWAECNRDFIEALFNTLTMPLGLILSLSKTDCGAANLYKSLETCDAYNERFHMLSGPLSRRLPVVEHTAYKSYFICESCRVSISDLQGTICPTCGTQIAMGATYVAPPNAHMPHLDEAHTRYVVFDNLTVKVHTFLACYGAAHFAPLNILEERYVEYRMTEFFKLVDVLLSSNTVLTDMFLKDNGESEGSQNSNSEV